MVVEWPRYAGAPSHEPSLDATGEITKLEKCLTRHTDEIVAIQNLSPNGREKQICSLYFNVRLNTKHTKTMAIPNPKLIPSDLGLSETGQTPSPENLTTGRTCTHA